jgi:isopenicillin N synthase-like dioxygenase
MVFDKEGLAKERKKPDFKESYEMGNEGGGDMHNIWPADDVIPGFREFFIRFFNVCYGMEVNLLRAIAVGMGLEDNFFIDYHANKNNNIRLLHYPPVEEQLLATGKVDSIGTHTDFGTLTMLFQDEVGELEVEDIHQKGKFNPAPYIPGTIVVNIGDFLMRWSNDELRSTLHHVRAPPGEPTEKGKPRMSRERYSIPYFVCADSERTIDCVPGCWGPDRPKKYEPIKSIDYLEMRLNASYAG